MSVAAVDRWIAVRNTLDGMLRLSSPEIVRVARDLVSSPKDLGSFGVVKFDHDVVDDILFSDGTRIVTFDRRTAVDMIRYQVRRSRNEAKAQLFRELYS